MKILDEKYRLFGRLSLFDIIIILVLIAVVIFAAYFLFLPKTSGDTAEVTYRVLLERQPYGLDNNIAVGDKVYNKTDNYEMGEIISFTTREYEDAVYNEKTGTAKMQKYPGKQTIELIIKGNFINREDRFYYNDTGLSSNTQLTFISKNFNAYGTIDFIYPSETTKEGQ